MYFSLLYIKIHRSRFGVLKKDNPKLLLSPNPEVEEILRSLVINKVFHPVLGLLLFDMCQHGPNVTLCDRLLVHRFSIDELCEKLAEFGGLFLCRVREHVVQGDAADDNVLVPNPVIDVVVRNRVLHETGNRFEINPGYIQKRSIVSRHRKCHPQEEVETFFSNLEFFAGFRHMERLLCLCDKIR